MRLKQTLLGLLIAVILIGTGVTAVIVVSHMLKTDPKKARLVQGKMPVSVAEAKVDTIKEVVGASGQTQEVEKVALTALISQPITSFKVTIGNLVKKGEVLAEFDQKLIKAALAEAKENVNRTKTDLNYSKTNFKRMQNLFQDNLIAKVELEKADADIKRLQWEHSKAMQQWEKVTWDLHNTVIKSPVRGIILERQVNQGETPKLNDPVIIIGIIDDIFMLARIPEEKISYVHLQQHAEIMFDSFANETFSGEIVKIDPSTDPKTKTFAAYIRIRNSDLRIKPGLTGFARIKNDKKGLAVPTVAVVNPVGEAATVFVIDKDSVAHIRRVKTGVSGGGLTEITEGLQQGDQVATAGIAFLKEGDKVHIEGGNK
ncbi:MAG: efflux RND transporter periplasmic adaptor subunit [Nitrospirae bacterium]|nr:efflux RND transporter periplasmic adaptor subunit [Nitrospirota bacterium]